MATLPRSPIARNVTNEVRVVSQARASGGDSVGAALEDAGNAGFEITSRIASAKIAADTAEASIRLRSRLDEEYRAIESDMTGDPSAFEARFRERAAAVSEEEAARLSSQGVRRAFALKSQELTEAFVPGVRDTTRRRQVDGVKAQVLLVGDEYSRLAQDVGKSREALEDYRNDYIALINRQVEAGIYSPAEAEAAKIAGQEVYRSGVSARHLANVDFLIEAGRFGEAREAFKAAYDEIAPADRERAERVIEAKYIEGEAVRWADDIWARSGGNYAQALEEVRKIEDIDARLAAESRLATMKNQTDAAQAAADQQALSEGMGYVVAGRSLPASFLRNASPLVIDRLQTEQRTRRLWDQQMAAASAQERAAIKEMSAGNHRILKAQIARDPELAAAGIEAILADPVMASLFDAMGPDQRGQFFLEVEGARQAGGVATDAVSKAYKSVVNVAAQYMPEGMKAENFGNKFRGLGEGDPGVRRVNQTRNKSKAALDFEGALFELVAEESQRLNGAEIPAERARQLVALAYAKAGEKKDGSTLYPLSEDVAEGINSVEERRAIMDFRRENADLWRAVSSEVRAMVPNASDALVLDEALKILRQRETVRQMRTTQLATPPSALGEDME